MGKAEGEGERGGREEEEGEREREEEAYLSIFLACERTLPAGSFMLASSMPRMRSMKLILVEGVDPVAPVAAEVEPCCWVVEKGEGVEAEGGGGCGDCVAVCWEEGKGDGLCCDDKGGSFCGLQ